MLLLLVQFNNSDQFQIYGVTRSYSSRLFLCALGQHNVHSLRQHINFDVQHLSCRVFSFPFQGGTSQPIGGSGDGGATFTPAVIISNDPPPPPPPTQTRTCDTCSGSVCDHGAGCEVMEMILGV